MRTAHLLLRAGPTCAAAVALPLALAPAPALAQGSGISVSTTGTTVSVTTSACAQLNGSWGTASLLTPNQGAFSEGRQATLSGTAGGQSATWSNVAPGTYTVVVTCPNSATAGTQSVIVSGQSGTTTTSTSLPVPAPSPTTPPTGGVLGGLGGGTRDFGDLPTAAGGALVGGGVVATYFVLRRRSRPRRF
ncbi:hypothetical protein FNH09_31550 [Streptomyces adustus]|uniref:Secreted protein n=1 Tax=Streptomyces adustus TaxID=1609272 RepID=A0A5N8VNI9_9ACTN|nr:hypothetical protein [Streptomyces adustus]MPY35608.1 hypothetical protein [Streptomyces adustus]